MSNNMLEVLFSCAAGEGQLCCSAWDFRTGTNLMNYKGGGGGSGSGGSAVQARSLCLLRSEYVMAANSTKPLLHVWPINAQEQLGSVRFVVAGRVSALAVSPCGHYLVAGIQETIYVWHLTTGRMLNTLAKHYQTVNVLRFTDDGSHFISAGQDGTVLVWNLTQVVTRGFNNQTPVYSFNDNGLPVTDLHVGVGGMRAYMISVSLDRSCKIYDLSSGTLLLSIVLPEALRCVTANALETCVYVGTTAGNIYELRIDAVPRTKEYHATPEQCDKFLGHKEGTAVTCLALSLDGQTLLSGGDDAQVCVWNIKSRQLLQALPQRGAVTNLQLRLTHTAVFQPEHKQPHVFAGNLRRMIDPPETDDDVTIEVLVTEQNAPDIEEIMGALPPSSSVTEGYDSTAALSVKEDVDNPSAELESLRTQVKKLLSTNKYLFEQTVKHLIGEPSE